MDDATTYYLSQPLLPYELIGLVAFHLCALEDLARLSLASRAFHFETTPYLYITVNFTFAVQQPKQKWVKTIILWARTIISNTTLASRVEKLVLHLPEPDLPAFFRRTLHALQSCVNLRDLELYHASYQTPFIWLLPKVPRFQLTNFTTDISASVYLAGFLESQPSIRTLRLEAFDMRMSLRIGSLPNLTHYTGFTMLISGARPPGTVWENLVYAELRDAYRWEKGLLDAMPYLRSLDITVASGGGDLFARIAEKCVELRSLTLRDGNGLLHDRHEFADERLSGVSLSYHSPWLESDPHQRLPFFRNSQPLLLLFDTFRP
jgi:hypothetical protein